jgi:anti-sigma regulatory factor (Ser/Thr protein kinase)
MRDDALELQIRDHGVGFQPVQPNPSLSAGNSKPLKKRGWGLKLMRSFMDAVYIRSSRRGTTVTMIKRKAFHHAQSTPTGG